jgi:hypothetical protein
MTHAAWAGLGILLLLISGALAVVYDLCRLL